METRPTYRSDQEKWFQCIVDSQNAEHCLICFPYAGGGASVYSNWHTLKQTGISVWTLSLPGRGHRYHEKPVTSLVPLLEQLIPEVLKISANKSVSFFGHSMGALIAYELACLLEQKNMLEISKLFLSGRSPVSQQDDEPAYHLLSDTVLMSKLIDMGGIPKEIQEHPEMLQLMLPTLRADFELIETWQSESSSTSKCPIIALAGSDDSRASVEKMEHWDSHTRSTFKLHEFDGGHFFLSDHQSDIIQLVRNSLLSDI